MGLAQSWLAVFEAGEKLLVPTGDCATAAEQLHRALAQAEHDSQARGYSPEQVREALFATLAWLDEQAMSRPWPGAAQWRQQTLQRQYFATGRAGVEFFQRLEALAAPRCPAREVYALALLAGFEGRFSLADDRARAEYRQRLFASLLGERGQSPLEQPDQLFEQPPPGLSAGRRRLRRGRPALVLLGLLLVPLLAVVLAQQLLERQLGGQVTVLWERLP